jgi:hypothetical protein
LFREFHLSVQETDDPVLDHADDSHGTPTRAKVLLERARSIAGLGIWNRQQRLRGQLLIQGLAALTPSVRLWYRHGNTQIRRPDGTSANIRNEPSRRSSSWIIRLKAASTSSAESP